MRDVQYLRAPLKKATLAGVTAAEAPPPAANPTSADPAAHALIFEFPYEANLEIALVLGSGSLRFVAGRPDQLPRSPGSIVRGAMSPWPLTGALVLHLQSLLVPTGLRRDLPFLGDVPSLVRYESVQLTESFLFDTALALGNFIFWHGGRKIVVRSGQPRRPDLLWREKLLFEFLHGRALVGAPLHPADPALDFSERAMPVVPAPEGGTLARLRISFANRSHHPESPTWFERREYDAAGLASIGPLVHPSLDSAVARAADPRHPAHSPIPAALVLGAAPDSAWVAGHRAHGFRAAAQRVLSAGAPYRRLQFVRPPIPGVTEPDEQRRAFLTHRAVVEPAAGAGRTETALPLDGSVYVRLADGTYRVRTVGRWEPDGTPSEPGHTGLALSRPRVAPARVGAFPAPAVEVPLGSADRVATLIVSGQGFDGGLVWDRVKRLGAKRLRTFQAKASNALNMRFRLNPGSTPAIMPARTIPVRDLFEPHRPIYGMIRDAAARHGLTPEFLLAAFMGEGVFLIKFLERGGLTTLPFAATEEEFVGERDLGADWIADNLVDFAGDPIDVPGSAIGRTDLLEHPDIGLQHLLEHGYIDPARFNHTHLDQIYGFTNEAGVAHFTARFRGWERAIELIAGLLHARLDQILVDANRPPAELPEQTLEFLSYVRYHGDLPTGNWRVIARQLDPAAGDLPLNIFDDHARLRRWPFAEYPHFANDQVTPPLRRLRHQGMFKVVVSDYLKLAEFFR